MKSRAASVAIISMASTVALLVTACGSSETTDTAQSPENTSGEFKLDSPVKIGILFEIKGESPYAVDSSNQGAMMAIDEINANGGIGGRQVESFRLAASPVDAQNTVSALVEAQSKKPTAIVGFVAPAQIAAASRTIGRSEIPVVAATASSPDFVYGSKAGQDNLWTSGVYDPRLTSTAIDYLVNDKGLKKIAIMGSNESYGNGGIASATEALKKQGLDPYAVAGYEASATDVTAQVLKVKGADAVVDWGYPAPLGVQLKQFRQNGLDIPTMASTSGLTLLGQKAVTPEDTKKFLLSLPCDTITPSYSPLLDKFAKRFKEKYSGAEVGGPIAPWAYDGVNAIAAAVKLAKSTDPAKVNKAMANINVDDGSGCGGPLKPDAGHVLTHEVVVTKVSADGTSKVEKTVMTDPVAKAAE